MRARQSRVPRMCAATTDHAAPRIRCHKSAHLTLTPGQYISPRRRVALMDGRGHFATRIVTFLLTVVLTLHLSPQNAIAAPNKLPIAPRWGACGVSSQENKVVRKYSKGYVLRCGGPRLSSNPSWGYRHITKRHRKDFGRLTPQLLMRRNWRDLTDFVIEWTIKDPDKTRSVGGGQMCRDRVFWLADAHGRTVHKQRFKLYTRGNRINTVFPSTKGC